ncbi:hypothetical protein V1479_16725 [Mesorhizobium sediminum]|uniref:Uncharacterized protein n=1 Tax=Neoaquamicrobium sediminum TaxID=1849104 RepID=A0ABV3WWA8_9HYPH
MKKLGLVGWYQPLLLADEKLQFQVHLQAGENLADRRLCDPHSFSRGGNAARFHEHAKRFELTMGDRHDWVPECQVASNITFDYEDTLT